VTTVGLLFVIHNYSDLNVICFGDMFRAPLLMELQQYTTWTMTVQLLLATVMMIMRWMTMIQRAVTVPNMKMVNINP